MKKTMIISAFPACGKTWLCKNQKNFSLSILDFESSRFVKESGWEKKYVDELECNIGKVDFIMIAQYENVLQELSVRKIPFVVVAPDNMEWTLSKERQLIKQQWFGRFILRDNSHIKDLSSWIKLLQTNYDNWTSVEHLTKYNPVTFFALRADEYLSDIILDLNFKRLSFEQYTQYKEDYK